MVDQSKIEIHELFKEAAQHLRSEFEELKKNNPRFADLALEWFRDLVQEARLHCTKFTLGTDAHAISSLDYSDQPGRTCLDILNDLNLSNKDLKWKSIKGFGVVD